METTVRPMYFSHCTFVLFFLQVKCFFKTDLENSLLGFGYARDLVTKQCAFNLKLVTISKSDHLSFIVIRAGVGGIVFVDFFPYVILIFNTNSFKISVL